MPIAHKSIRTCSDDNDDENKNQKTSLGRRRRSTTDFFAVIFYASIFYSKILDLDVVSLLEIYPYSKVKLKTQNFLSERTNAIYDSMNLDLYLTSRPSCVF